jgi:hypothetical protein
MTSVMHHPRVAWDLAQTTLAMAEADDVRCVWFAEQFALRLGAIMQRELQQTRDRLARDTRPDMHPVELGRWRARIEDVLLEDRDLAEELTRLRLDANSRLAES